MSLRVVARAAPVLALVSSSLAAAPAAAQVAPEQMRRHIEVLASDEYEGRKPGTAGENKTLLYIAGQFARLGLEPAGGSGSWYQPVGLVQRKPGSLSARFASRGRRVAFDEDDLILVGRGPLERLRDAPVYYLPAEAKVPEGAELKGAVLLLPYSTPKGLPGYARRAARAREAGAGAVIALFGDDTPRPAIETIYEDGPDRLASEAVAPIEGGMTMSAASSLLKRARLSGLPGGDAPVRLPIQATLEVSTNVREYASHNVIGRLRGTGSSGESVLYLGHWDHLGLCRAEGAPDRVCNGAVDNASGIAMMIEIAADLARGKRPERDILFMATTAEEMGLLGAEYFAAHPTVPLKSIVAAINLDTVAIHRRGAPVSVIGRGVAPLDRLIAETAAQMGRKMDEDAEAEAFAARQDGWMLARAGVPAVMVGGSFADMGELGRFLSGPYHQPNDDLGRELVLDGAAEDADLLIALGRKLADPRIYRPPAAGGAR